MVQEVNCAHTNVGEKALESVSIGSYSHDQPHHGIVCGHVQVWREVGENLEQEDHQLLQRRQEGLGQLGRRRES